MRRVLHGLWAVLTAMVCEVLTLLVQTLPRLVREMRASQDCDFKLAERLRRREYDWRDYD